MVFTSEEKTDTTLTQSKFASQCKIDTWSRNEEVALNFLFALGPQTSNFEG